MCLQLWDMRRFNYHLAFQIQNLARGLIYIMCQTVSLKTNNFTSPKKVNIQLLIKLTGKGGVVA